MKKSKLSNKIRIIGGLWRGRKIQFPNLKNLRPTPDRIRETLFNWLTSVIDGACCLDLFAGSGALGFEALSRGAGKVVLVDAALQVIQQLKVNQQILDAKNLEIHHMDAEQYIFQAEQVFDIIFLDPPFTKHLIPKFCQLIAKNNFLKPNGYVYIETDAALSLDDLPKTWQIIKQKQAGKVLYYLLRAKEK